MRHYLAPREFIWLDSAVNATVGGAATREGFDLEMHRKVLAEAKARRQHQIERVKEDIDCKVTFEEPGPLGIKWMLTLDKAGRDVACVKGVRPGGRADQEGTIQRGMVLGYIQGEWCKVRHRSFVSYAAVHTL